MQGWFLTKIKKKKLIKENEETDQKVSTSKYSLWYKKR